VTHGKSFPRTGRISVLATALAGLLAGCSGYSSLQDESYPRNLEYPQRSDLLVKDMPTTEARRLPPPGKLDESIARAVEINKDKARGLKPSDLDRKEAEDLKAVLKNVFGTPSRPRVGPDEDTDAYTVFAEWRNKVMSEQGFTAGEALENLELDPVTLARGSKLYRRHCLHCHGLSGDGRGPTGPWVHPHPRDYRQGEFKFLSTAAPPAVPTRKPRRADLLRILKQGIDGTSMPAFGLMPEHDLQYLASYVMHLSIRGQVEYQTMFALLEKDSEGKRKLAQYEGKDGKGASEIAHHVYNETALAIVAWARSNHEKPIEPPAYTAPSTAEERHASIRAGFKVFSDQKKSGCASCHTDYGRQPNYRYDTWGTLVRPYNLTNNVYRGGRRPVDLYWRIRGGIGPSGMPGVANLTNDEYWQLVNFLEALPYPAMLPDDVRQAVYGKSESKKEKGG
jgi:mono/diheme cytochrome c family protein